ncbi:MAG: ABC transporter permease [candidate division KSB1 bacterium]|nr:ABC transporter permease [candidate division KSB1 bacterium]
MNDFSATTSLMHGIQQLLRRNFVLTLTVGYFIVMSALLPAFASSRNLANLSSNFWPLLSLVIGQLLVMIVGGIDLSQSSIMALASVCGASLMCQSADPVVFAKAPLWNIVFSEQGGFLAGSVFAVSAAVAVMLTVGILVGFFNGFAVAYLKMPPFIVTLVSMMFFSGAAIYLTASENITHLPTSFTAIAQKRVLLPIPVWIVAASAIVVHIILQHTAFGKKLYAVGLNAKAALISGINVPMVTLTAFTLSGFFAALGSVIYSARLEGGRPTLGQDLLLDVIGAAVIGGISLFGGRGRVRDACAGALFFTLLANSLNLMNLSFFIVNIVKGGVILLAAAVDAWRVGKSGGMSKR